MAAQVVSLFSLSHSFFLSNLSSYDARLVEYYKPKEYVAAVVCG